MTNQVIEAPKGARYLSQFLTDLPVNCLFDKFSTGCGGTTLALSNNQNYVVCVPFVSLIENKLAQHKDILGVYGKTKDSDIKRYVENSYIPTKKIMVTYDSLGKLFKYINPQDYRLLVDELHILFQSIVFRNTACNVVLESYTKFKSYCFMTATMLEEEFILKELAHLPIVTVKWQDVQEVTVKTIKCKHDVIHATHELINGFLSGEIEGNAHIFVNSVLFMKDMVRICKLNDTNAKAVWSDSNLTKTGLLKSKTTDPVKKINFYSSVSFQGVDIYDDDGKTFVISDKSRCHSLLDISTSFCQIVNRVRKSKYRDTITHIFTSTRYDIDLDYTQFKKFVDNSVVKDTKVVKEFNQLSEDALIILADKFKPKEIEKVDANTYIVFNGVNFEYDENLMKYDLFNYKVTKHLYKMHINLIDAYEEKGFKVEDSENLTKVKNIAKASPKENFRETVLECKKNDKDFYQWAIGKYPFLEQAFTLLGYDGIEELDYHIGNIKRKLLAMSNKTLIEQLYNTLRMDKVFLVGNFYSYPYIKEVMTDYYNRFGITSVPTVSAIKEFYKVRATSKKISEGNGVKTAKIDGFVILK